MHCNCEFIDELVNLRTKESDEQVREVLLRDVPEGDAGSKQRAQISKRKAKKSDAALSADVVNITIPPCDGHQEFKMKVLWGIKNENVFIEVTKENINYIRMRIQGDHAMGRVGRSKNPKLSPRSANESDDDGKGAESEVEEDTDRRGSKRSCSASS